MAVVFSQYLSIFLVEYALKMSVDGKLVSPQSDVKNLKHSFFIVFHGHLFFLYYIVIPSWTTYWSPDLLTNKIPYWFSLLTIYRIYIPAFLKKWFYCDEVLHYVPEYTMGIINDKKGAFEILPCTGILPNSSESCLRRPACLRVGK